MIAYHDLIREIFMLIHVQVSHWAAPAKFSNFYQLIFVSTNFFHTFALSTHFRQER